MLAENHKKPPSEMWHSCDTVVRLDRKTSLHKHWRNSANQKYQTSKPKTKEPCSHAVSKKPFSIQISRICLRIHIRISTRTRRADSNTVHNQGIPSQPSWVIGFPILWVIITANTLWYTKKKTMENPHFSLINQHQSTKKNGHVQ